MDSSWAFGALMTWLCETSQPPPNALINGTLAINCCPRRFVAVRCLATSMAWTGDHFEVQVNAGLVADVGEVQLVLRGFDRRILLLNLW